MVFKFYYLDFYDFWDNWPVLLADKDAKLKNV